MVKSPPQLHCLQTISAKHGCQFAAVRVFTHQQREKFTKAILEDYLNEKYAANDFISFMEDGAAKDKSVTAGALKEWSYSIHMFSEFCGVNGCEFSQLNDSRLNDYDNYLRGRGPKQNTIHKHHKNLRRFINLAIKKKYLITDAPPFKEFSSRQVTGTRTNVTIEGLDFCAPEFEQIRVVRDMFVFLAYYTGMRYYDVVKLSSPLQFTPKTSPAPNHSASLHR